MAETTEEIAIKLGVSNYEFVTAVRDAEESVKKLKEEGKKSEQDNGLMKSFQQSREQMEKLKAMLGGAGMLKVIGDFFNGAIKYANEFKGAQDDNIDAVKRFGEGYESLKVNMMGIGVQVLGSLNRIGEAAMDAGKYWIAFAQGQEDAWINNEIALEKSKKALAETLKLIQEQAKYTDEHKKLNQEMAALREKEQQQNLKKLTDLEQVNALENRILEIRRSIDSGELTAIERHRAEVDLKKNQLLLDEKSSALYAKTVADQRKANEDQRAAKLDQVSNEQKIKTISQEILDIQNMLNAKVLNASDTEYYTAQLKTRQLELTKAQTVQQKESVAEEKKKQQAIESQSNTLATVVNPEEQKRLDLIRAQAAAEGETTNQLAKQVSMSQAMQSSVQNYLSGFVSSSNSADQSKWDSMTISGATKQITDQMNGIQKMIDNYRATGNQWGEYQIPALQNMIQTLRNRLSNVKAYAFDPNYSDALGSGIMAAQVSQIGDPLGLQKKNTDTNSLILSTLQTMDKRLSNGAGLSTISGG